MARYINNSLILYQKAPLSENMVSLMTFFEPSATIAIQNNFEPVLRLKPKISWCRYLEFVDDLGNKIAAQFNYFEHTIVSSTTTLEQKFDAEEITFARYKKILDLSQHLIIDNFKKIIPLLEMLDAIGETQFEDSSHPLSNNSENNHAAFQKQIDELYVYNQQLLNKIHELILELSKLKNLGGIDADNANELLLNLSTLTERAKFYR